jgi:hypothetical protein
MATQIARADRSPAYDENPDSGTCILCGGTYREHGNNPEPVAQLDDGRCCHECNSIVVIPVRALIIRAREVARTRAGNAA